MIRRPGPAGVFFYAYACEKNRRLYDRYMQELFFYIDDSGVLHRNSGDRFFIYAGYAFKSKRAKDAALAKYRAAEAKFGNRKHELKACRLKAKSKRFLNSVLSDNESFGCVVQIGKVYGRILQDRQSIHRFKDYCIKLAIKSKIQSLLRTRAISADEDTNIRLFIDNQPTSTNGYYNLCESIREEFQSGVENFNYSTHHAPIFRSHIEVTATFCDSAKTVLIRASDLLANALYSKYNHQVEPRLRHAHYCQIDLP